MVHCSKALEIDHAPLDTELQAELLFDMYELDKALVFPVIAKWNISGIQYYSWPSNMILFL